MHKPILDFRLRFCAVFFGVASLTMWVPCAMAGSIVLGSSGWRASWDDSIDPFVDVALDLVTSNSVFIEKTAEFTEPPGPGGFPGIAIVFQQIAAGAVERIVINDEIITNSTGADWTDFHMELLDTGEALFNPTLTNNSGARGGFNTSPFDNQMFGDGNSTLWLDGFGLGPGGSDAVIPDGDKWFPGIGAGELYIDTTPRDSAPFTLFTLKETPTPEPATGLLIVAGVFTLPRPRRFKNH